MGFKYSKKSREKLETCHPDLQRLFNEVIKHVDCTILEGVRTKERQEDLVRTGRSKTMNSKHLDKGDGYSHAIDVSLYPIVWDQPEKFIAFSFFVKGIATSMGIKIRLGVDWDGDFDITEHNFFDGPHIELVL